MLRLWWLLHLSTGDGEYCNRFTSFLQMIGRNLRWIPYAGVCCQCLLVGPESANDLYPFPFGPACLALFRWFHVTTLQIFALCSS